MQTARLRHMSAFVFLVPLLTTCTPRLAFGDCLASTAICGRAGAGSPGRPQHLTPTIRAVQSRSPDGGRGWFPLPTELSLTLSACVLGVARREERYSLRQAATLLGVHLATVWRWVLHGVRGRKLPTVMVGGRRYILARDLDDFLAADDSAADRAPHEPVDLDRRAGAVSDELDRLGI